MIPFLAVFLNARTIEAKYKVSYGKLLKLGVATSTLEINNDKYKIKIEVSTTGMAKYLTSNRVEIYESYGKVIDHELIPEKFVKIKQDKKKKRIRTYTFNQEEKIVKVHDIKFGKKKIVNAELRFDEKKYREERDYTLDYFAKDDLLSLFFNMHIKMVGYEDGEEYELKAVGANKTKGIINVAMPTKEQLKKIDKVLKTNDKSKFTAYINQKIFQSKRGELLISLNDYGFCNKAVLKDVLLFGDIVGEMTDFKIKEG